MWRKTNKCTKIIIKGVIKYFAFTECHISHLCPFDYPLISILRKWGCKQGRTLFGLPGCWNIKVLKMPLFFQPSEGIIENMICLCRYMALHGTDLNSILLSFMTGKKWEKGWPEHAILCGELQLKYAEQPGCPSLWKYCSSLSLFAFAIVLWLTWCYFFLSPP